MQTEASKAACVYCSKPCPEIESDNHVVSHAACREAQSCGACGVAGLNVMCKAERCVAVLHPWCMQRYSEFCSAHQGKNKRKDADRAGLAKLALRKAVDDQALLRSLKETYSSQCSGAVFWFAISDFFPAEADLASWPDFASVPTFDPDVLTYPSEISSDDYVAAVLRDTESDLKSVVSELEALRAELPNEKPTQTRLDESAIVVELKMIEFRGELEEYLTYFEKTLEHNKDFTVEGKSSKGNSGMRKAVKPDDDCVCEVCGDGDYDEDDLIVICSECEKGFHMHCYGIPEVPEGDWICDLCSELGHNALRPPCALCTQRDGAMKPTIHLARGSTFPNYLEGQDVAKVWVHVFCARQMAGVTVSDSAHFSGIDLSRIPLTRFRLECETCKTKNGACLQCTFRKCRLSFHPECGKAQFIETRVKSEIEEGKMYCNHHKPSKLRRLLVVKEKKQIDDVAGFAKTYEDARKAEDPRKKRKRVQEAVYQLDKPFSMEEDWELEHKLDRALRAVRKHCTSKFTVSFRLNSKSKRGQAAVEQPRYYTLIAPEVILKDKVRIEGRTVGETFVHYKEKQYPRLKKELEATTLPFMVFRNRLVKYIKSADKKRKGAKKQVSYVQTQLMMAPQAIVSEDLYCVCRKPYIEKVSADPNLTEEEFHMQQIDNTMLECEQCADWFHWGCMKVLGYSKALLTQTDAEFLCPNCNPKRPKLSEEITVQIDEPVLS